MNKYLNYSRAEIAIILQNLILLVSFVFLGFDLISLWAAYYVQAMIFCAYCFVKLVFLKDYFVSKNAMELNSHIYSNVGRTPLSKIYLAVTTLQYLIIPLSLLTAVFSVLFYQRINEINFIIGIAFSSVVYASSLILMELGKRAENKREYIDFYTHLPLQKIIFENGVPLLIVGILWVFFGWLISIILSLLSTNPQLSWILGLIPLILLCIGKIFSELGEEQYKNKSYSEMLHGQKSAKDKKVADFIHEDNPENDSVLWGQLKIAAIFPVCVIGLGIFMLLMPLIALYPFYLLYFILAIFLIFGFFVFKSIFAMVLKKR